MAAEEATLTLPGEEGGERDFEQAIAPERERLFALAIVIMRNPSDAEDVVQDTLLSAWRSWPKLRDPSRPGPWLTRICVNHCLHHRGRRARAVWFTAGPDQQVAALPQPQLSGELLDFDRAFARLPARQRAAFALHVHYGYTVVECAQYLGCRPGTARSHLGRAVAALKREMNHV